MDELLNLSLEDEIKLQVALELQAIQEDFTVKSDEWLRRCMALMHPLSDVNDPETMKVIVEREGYRIARTTNDDGVTNRRCLTLVKVDGETHTILAKFEQFIRDVPEEGDSEEFTLGVAYESTLPKFS